MQSKTKYTLFKDHFGDRFDSGSLAVVECFWES